jgi:hypothetical protein
MDRQDRGLTFAQITPQKSFNGSSVTNEFGSGVQEFRVSVGGGKRLDLSRSYLSLTATIEMSNGATPPVYRPPSRADGIAFADSPVGNCYQSVSLLAGSTEIGQLDSNAPQVGTLATRLNRSGAWLNSVGKGCFGLEPDFDKRVTVVSSDLPTTTVFGIPTVGGVAGTFAGGTVTDMPDYMSGLSLADNNTQTFMWRPPLGAFELATPLPAGSFTLQLNPDSTGWYRNIIESSAALSSSEYRVVVVDLRFYACLVEDISPVVSEIQLTTNEVLCTTKSLSQGESQSHLEFTVPPSTYAIALAFQGRTFGQSTDKNIGRLWANLGRSELKLLNLQLTFANTSKPSVQYSTPHGLQQRWYDSLVHLGQSENGGGTETYNDWLTRGPVLYFSFEREELDRSTQLTVQAQFEKLADDVTLQVYAFHKRASMITVDRGFVTEVKSVAM